MTDRRPHRHALGQFLRTRRLATKPSYYGFPAGRRRIPGLRREEVALLAGVSPSWYTHLEQGRDIRPSTDVLDRLGEVLKLRETEVTYMHVLALGQGPPRGLRPATPELVAIGRRLIEQHSLPAYLSNAASDILAWNTAAAEWYTDFSALAPDHRNLAWWMVMSPDAPARLVDFEDELRSMLGLIRAALVKVDGFTGVEQVPVIAELLNRSDVARQSWNAHTVADHVPRTRHLQRKNGERKLFQLMPMFDLYGQDLGVVLHLPAPA